MSTNKYKKYHCIAFRTFGIILLLLLTKNVLAQVDTNSDEAILSPNIDNINDLAQVDTNSDDVILSPNIDNIDDNVDNINTNIDNIVISPSILLAKIKPLLVTSNRINDKSLETSYGTGKVYIYKLPKTNPAVLVVQTSGAIDCDGQKTTQCNKNTDPWYQKDTSFHQSDGKPLNAAKLPFYVLPEIGNYFDYSKNNIKGGQLGAILYKNNMNYGVFGDECADNREIGEISYAMAASLGINPDPTNGGVESGVTFIIFTGTQNVVSPIESHSEADTMGNQAMTLLWSQLN